MRVALPVEMPNLVNSEVATMTFARRHTNAPIPVVHAYDCTNDNELRFPWLLVDFVHGTPLNDVRWRSVSLDSKIALVKQLAEFHSRLLSHKFQVVGSLQHHPSIEPVAAPDRPMPHLQESPTPTAGGWLVTFSLIVILFLSVHSSAIALVLGLLLSLLYLRSLKGLSARDNDIQLGGVVSNHCIAVDEATSRGPFFSTADWLYARVSYAVSRYESSLREYDLTVQDHSQTMQDINSLAKRLLALVPRLFPQTLLSEPTSLSLHDICEDNILVDEQGRLVGIVELSLMCTSPLWNVCQPPELLFPWQIRLEKPIRDRYPLYDEQSPLAEPKIIGVNSAYWDDLQSYEITMILEPLFFAEMEQLHPGWGQMYRDSKAKRQFLEFVNAIAQGNWRSEHVSWLEKMENGESIDELFELPRYNNDGEIDWERSWFGDEYLQRTRGGQADTGDADEVHEDMNNVTVNSEDDDDDGRQISLADYEHDYDSDKTLCGDEWWTRE